MMKKEIKSALVWGDSVARGVILEDGRQRYTLSPYPAANLVAEELGIQVINRSRMGITSADGVMLQQKDIEKGLRADVAVLEFGGNDCDFNWKEISDAPEQTHLPKTSAEVYEKNMKQMIQSARDAGMEPILCNLPPIYAEKYFSFISESGLSSDNILRWLGDKFQIYRFQERYSMIATKVAIECGCRLCDIRSAFLNVWDYKNNLYCRDGIHPTTEGQRLIGQTILASL